MKLDLWQKRQAALIYHFASRPYLLTLKAKLQALIDGADMLLDLAKEQGRDALIISERWGVRDTAKNWSSYGFPALLDFRASIGRQLARMEQEEFHGTGASQCAHMLSEFSSRWMSEDEEAEFQERFQVVYQHASLIDDVTYRPPRLDDFGFNDSWQRWGTLIPRLPKLVVREDIVGRSGERPPRTGVYVPQDDRYGTLQFAWTGGQHGVLTEAATFNDAALHIVNAVGRDRLWTTDTETVRLVRQAITAGHLSGFGPYKPGDADKPESIPHMLAFSAFTQRPCKWFFVEVIDGEFDDEANDHDDAGAAQSRDRVQANRPCPKDGWWITPARANSRCYFKSGSLMPDFGSNSDYGETIWQWDSDQSNPSL